MARVARRFHLRGAGRSIALLVVAVGMTACAAAQEPSPPTPLPGGSCTLGLAADAGDEETIRALLRAEGEQVVAQEIELLMALWADESFIADAKNTPDDPDDDQRWIDKDAIRHRYVRTVFPGAPAAIQPADLETVLEGERAVVRATTQVGSEIAPAGDRWTLIKRNGCWYLESLTYNLEEPN